MANMNLRDFMFEWGGHVNDAILNKQKPEISWTGYQYYKYYNGNWRYEGGTGSGNWWSFNTIGFNSGNYTMYLYNDEFAHALWTFSYEKAGVPYKLELITDDTPKNAVYITNDSLIILDDKTAQVKIYSYNQYSDNYVNYILYVYTESSDKYSAGKFPLYFIIRDYD